MRSNPRRRVVVVAFVGLVACFGCAQTDHSKPADDAGTLPVTAKALLSAEVPSACDHHPGWLSNGELPGIPDGEGSVSLAWMVNPARRRDTLALGRIDGVGPGAAAVVLQCDAGGVALPDVVAVYGPGPKLYGSISLGRIHLLGQSGSENANTESVSVEDRRVAVRWSTQQDDEDPAAISSLDYSALLGPPRRGSLKVTRLKGTNEVPTATRFLNDLRESDVEAAARVSALGVTAQATAVFGAAPEALQQEPSCHGINAGDLPEAITRLSDVGGPDYLASERLCLLPTNGEQGSSDVVLGMSHTGFRSWQISWVKLA